MSAQRDGKKGVSKILENLLKSPKKSVKPRFIHYKRCPLTGHRLTQKRNVPTRKYKKKNVHTARHPTDELSYTNESEDSFPQSEQDVDIHCYDETVENCLLLLGGVPVKRKKRTWHDQATSCNANWRRNKANIMDILLSRESISGSCDVCHERDSIIKCQNCFHANLCYSCDDIVHASFPLHDRACFLNGYEEPLLPIEAVDEDMNIREVAKGPWLQYNKCKECHCSDMIKRYSEETCVVITMKGRYDLYKYEIYCKHCQTIYDPFNLECVLKSGYWPGSPVSIHCLIQEEVFMTWDAFRKRMPGSSANGFLMALFDIGSEQKRDGKINPNNFSAAFKEWNFYRFEKDKLQEKNWLECPSCEVKQHSAHVDGNCKLYRYRSSGKGQRLSYYGNYFFFENKAVDEYLKKLYGTAGYKLKNAVEVDNRCGGIWTAARNVKQKTHSLDETGIDLTSCRHYIGQKALNMFQGELFGYPLYLMKEFMLSRNVSYCFADVMCKLWKFVKDHDSNVYASIKPALSVMHAKGHSFDCQVLWSGEWTKGTGKSTGEETEQVFSFLSRCANTTKYRTPENREETITEMMLSWNKRKISFHANELLRRYKKTQSQLVKARTTVQSVKQKTGLHDFERIVEHWIKDIKLSASGVVSHKTKTQLSPSQKILLLKKDLRENEVPLDLHFPKTIKKESYWTFLQFDQKDKELELQRLLAMEQPTPAESVYESIKEQIWKPLFHRDIEKLVMEKTVWVANIKKIADTSKRRHVLRAKLASHTKLFKEKVKEYCALFAIIDVAAFLLQCENGVFPWLLNRDDQLLVGSAADRRLCVEVHIAKVRLEEELELLLTDMRSCLSFYCAKIKALKEKRKELDLCFNSGEEVREVAASQQLVPPDSCVGVTEGKLALISKGLSYYHDCVNKAIQAFGYLLDSRLTVDLMDTTEADESELEEQCGDYRDMDGSEVEEDSLSDGSENAVVLDGKLISELGLDSAERFLLENFKVVDDQCGITTVLMPPLCCQSRLAGANGSNACVLISLLVGCWVTEDILKDFPTKHFWSRFLPLFCGSIEFANMTYEFHNLEGNIDIGKAFNLLPLKLKILHEDNYFVVGNGGSCLANFFATAATDVNSFYIIIVDERAFYCKRAKQNWFCVDSHEHAAHGGKIVMTDSHLEDMLLEITSEQTSNFAYLAMVQFDC